MTWSNPTMPRSSTLTDADEQQWVLVVGDDGADSLTPENEIRIMKAIDSRCEGDQAAEIEAGMREIALDNPIPDRPDEDH